MPPSPCNHPQPIDLRLSVIVPTLNEQAHLQTTLASVDLGAGDDLIIVDGGSCDATQDIARQFTSCVLSAPRGRARQMNAGARQAQGDVLLFLHADTQLPPGGLNRVRDTMRQPQIAGGAFRLSLTPPTRLLRLIAWGANVRTRFGKRPYGDQAIFIRRSLFEAIGGYADTPFWRMSSWLRHCANMASSSLCRKPSVPPDAAGNVKASFIQRCATTSCCFFMGLV